MKTKVKICGINSLKALKAANRADFLGFIFYGKSPRFVNAKKAKLLADSCLSFQKKVGLFVDSDNHVIEYITEYVGLDYIQLHGDENIEKIKYLKNKLNVPIIKSIPIKTIEDFQKLSYYEKVCDIILLDSKPSNNSLTGGTGKTFNWKLLKNISFEKEYLKAKKDKEFKKEYSFYNLNEIKFRFIRDRFLIKEDFRNPFHMIIQLHQ